MSDLPALAGAIPVRLREHVAARPDRGLRDIAARGEHRLPPEDELSRLVAVSRPTVRSAPQTLQEEGRVRRVRGRQRFVNRHSLELRANPAEDRSFLDLLERLGLVVDTRTLGVFEIALPLDVIDSLGLAAGATGVPVDRVFEASGAPAVLSVDQAPRELFPGAVAELEAGSSTFELVRANSSQRIRYSVAELVPVLPDAHTAELLAVGRHHALLLLRHVHVGECEQPLLETTALVNDRYLRFSIVRTYLGA